MWLCACVEEPSVFFRVPLDFMKDCIHFSSLTLYTWGNVQLSTDFEGCIVDTSHAPRCGSNQWRRRNPFSPCEFSLCREKQMRVQMGRRSGWQSSCPTGGPIRAANCSAMWCETPTSTRAGSVSDSSQGQLPRLLRSTGSVELIRRTGEIKWQAFAAGKGFRLVFWSIIHAMIQQERPVQSLQPTAGVSEEQV